MASPAQYDFIGDGSTRIFPIGSRIISQQYIKLEVNEVEILDTTSYDIINNSIVFVTPPLDTYSVVVRVVQAIEDLPELDNLTATQIVADNILDVIIVADDIEAVTEVSDNMEDIVKVASEDFTDLLRDSDTVSPVTPTNKLLTEAEGGGGGDGDMLKATYDYNNSGRVDDAELVNGLTVETAVPISAVFTDTVYDDSDVLKDSDTASPVTPLNKIMTADDVANLGGGDMLKATYDQNNSGMVDDSELVNGLTVETAVPVSAVFTDTVYDDSDVLKDSDTVSPVTPLNKLLTEAEGGGGTAGDRISQFEDFLIGTDFPTLHDALRWAENATVTAGAKVRFLLPSGTHTLGGGVAPIDNGAYYGNDVYYTFSGCHVTIEPENDYTNDAIITMHGFDDGGSNMTLFELESATLEIYGVDLLFNAGTYSYYIQPFLLQTNSFLRLNNLTMAYFQAFSLISSAMRLEYVTCTNYSSLGVCRLYNSSKGQLENVTTDGMPGDFQLNSHSNIVCGDTVTTPDQVTPNSAWNRVLPTGTYFLDGSVPFTPESTIVATGMVIDFGSGLDFAVTATATTVTADGFIRPGQSGTIVITSADLITGWSAEFEFKTVPTDLTGEETFGYYVLDANTIKIGRVT